jgi:hypothetical protein
MIVMELSLRAVGLNTPLFLESSAVGGCYGLGFITLTPHFVVN